MANRFTQMDFNSAADVRVINSNFNTADTAFDDVSDDIQDVANGVSAEANRASGAETQIQAAITAEINRAQNAEQINASDISNNANAIVALQNTAGQLQQDKLDKTADIKALEKVNTLPASPDANTLYVVPGSSGSNLHMYSVYIHEFYMSLSPVVEVTISFNIVTDQDVSNIMINAENTIGDGSFTSNDVYDALLSLLPADTTITGDYFPRLRFITCNYTRRAGTTYTGGFERMAYLTASQSDDNVDEFVFDGESSFAMRRVSSPDVFSYDGTNTGTLSVIKVF